MRQHVARTRLLRFLPLEAASSQLVVSSDLGELEASMAGICTVSRPRPVAWDSWAGISPPSIDLTDHGGGLVVAVGGRPRDAWAPLLRPPTHTGLGRSHGRSALGRRKVHGGARWNMVTLRPSGFVCSQSRASSSDLVTAPREVAGAGGPSRCRLQPVKRGACTWMDEVRPRWALVLPLLVQNCPSWRPGAMSV